jgi:NADH-quinone oxidoreductase subunit C
VEGLDKVTNEEILAKIKDNCAEAVVEAPEGMKDFTIVLAPEHLVATMTFLRDSIGMDYLSSLTAVDYPDRFEVVYHLYSVAQCQGLLTLKVRLTDKQNPEIASVTPVWPGASLQECEVFDLMGIRFTGHPALRRIMTWDGFPGHPLRKEFQNRTFTFKELEPTRPKPPNW